MAASREAGTEPGLTLLPPVVRRAPFARAAFEEDVVAKRFLWRHLMIMNRPDGVHRILVDNAANYVRPATAFRILGPPIGGGLFLADGAEWRRQRRMLAPFFSPRAVPDFAHHVARHARDLVAELSIAAPGEIELFAPLRMLTLSVAAKALFSMDIRPHIASIQALARDYATRLAQPTMLDFLLPAGIPSPRDLPRARFRRRWMALIARMIAERRRSPPDSPDLFDLLAASEIERGLFDQQVATMLITGSETTGAALFWSIYLLADHPEAQARVAAEAMASDRGALDDPAQAYNLLPYTRAVVQEALRLYPPALSIVREALADDEAGGVVIPKGATVEMAPWVLHRHRKLWREPNRFDPRPVHAGRAAARPRHLYALRHRAARLHRHAVRPGRDRDGGLGPDAGLPDRADIRPSGRAGDQYHPPTRQPDPVPALPKTPRANWPGATPGRSACPIPGTSQARAGPGSTGRSSA